MKPREENVRPSKAQSQMLSCSSDEGHKKIAKSYFPGPKQEQNLNI